MKYNEIEISQHHNHRYLIVKNFDPERPLMWQGTALGRGNFVPDDQKFATEAERDAFFEEHPDRLDPTSPDYMPFCIVAGDLFAYIEGEWQGAIAMIMGDKGESGEDGYSIYTSSAEIDKEEQTDLPRNTIGNPYQRGLQNNDLIISLNPESLWYVGQIVSLGDSTVRVAYIGTLAGEGRIYEGGEGISVDGGKISAKVDGTSIVFNALGELVAVGGAGKGKLPDFDPDKSFTMFDPVVVDARLYRLVVPKLPAGEMPDFSEFLDIQYWRLVQAIEAYADGTDYEPNDIVADPETGSAFICYRAHTSDGATLSDDTAGGQNWLPYDEGWVSKQYTKGDEVCKLYEGSWGIWSCTRRNSQENFTPVVNTRIWQPIGGSGGGSVEPPAPQTKPWINVSHDNPRSGDLELVDAIALLDPDDVFEGLCITFKTAPRSWDSYQLVGRDYTDPDNWELMAAGTQTVIYPDDVSEVEHDDIELDLQETETDDIDYDTAETETDNLG